MDTNRKFLKTCIAAMVLLAGSASAQTMIYKQVDGEGRVVFTDRPDPAARIVQSFETSRSRSQPSPDAEDASRAVREPVRRVIAEAQSSPGIESAPGISVESSPRVVAAGVPVALAGATRGRGEVERAVFSYASLNTHMAAQIDATEAARRARQEIGKDPGKAVLVLQQSPRSSMAASTPQTGLSMFYWMWVATFFMLAAGLLYVAFQVFRLILGGPFPRWELGLD